MPNQPPPGTLHSNQRELLSNSFHAGLPSGSCVLEQYADRVAGFSCSCYCTKRQVRRTVPLRVTSTITRHTELPQTQGCTRVVDGTVDHLDFCIVGAVLGISQLGPVSPFVVSPEIGRDTCQWQVVGATPDAR